MVIQKLDEQVAERLSSAGVRYTAGRRSVIQALEAAPGPQSATELHELMGSSLPLSSLYRTLMVLAEAEVLSGHFSSKGVARYEIAEWLSGHHHHLVCIDCGRVDDIDIAEHHEVVLHEMVDEVARSVAFSAVGHALEIAGRCGRCL